MLEDKKQCLRADQQHKKCAKRHRFAISKLYFPRSRNDRCVFHLSFLFLLLLYPPPSTTHQIYISPKPHNHTACHKPQVTSVNTAIHPFGTFDFWQKLFNVRSKYKLGFATRGLNANLGLATRKSVTELCQKISLCAVSQTWQIGKISLRMDSLFVLVT